MTVLKTPIARNKTTSIYRIGPVGVALSTSVEKVAAAYDALYSPFAVDESSLADAATFKVRVFRQRSWRTGLSHYHIESDVDDRFTVRRLSRVLPHVEGAVNLCIARYMPGYLLLHAAAVTRHGMGVVIPGGPGFGKTTLAAALTSRGWQYASDEFAMIHPGNGTLAPYPKALSIKSGSYGLLRDFGLPVEAAPMFDRADKGAIRLLPAKEIRPDVIASTARIGMIVFPSLKPGAEPQVTPMSPAEAVFEMSRRCFNLLRFRSRGIKILSNVAMAARCFRIRTGDLAMSCRVMDHLADQAAAGCQIGGSGAQSLSAA